MVRTQTLKHSILALSLLLCSPGILAQPLLSLDDTCSLVSNSSSMQEKGVQMMAVGDMVFTPESLSGQRWLQTPIQDHPLFHQFHQSDVVLGNLESPATDQNQSTKESNGSTRFAFRISPSLLSRLKEIGFTHLHVANNHMFDYGEQGFKDTIQGLKREGLQSVGWEDKEYNLQGGLNVQVLGFSYVPTLGSSLLHIQESASRVRAAKEKGSYVIVSFHGGAEGPAAAVLPQGSEYFLGEARGDLRVFAHKMVEAGADIVIGHGPHVLRASECYHQKPIIYSLGNFVGAGGLANSGIQKNSAALKWKVSAKGELQSLELIPVKLNEKKYPEWDTTGQVISYIQKLTRMTNGLADPLFIKKEP